jgi:hypothetical protein
MFTKRQRLSVDGKLKQDVLTIPAGFLPVSCLEVVKTGPFEIGLFAIWVFE